MLSYMTIMRLASSNGPYLVGPDAAQILSRIDGISGVTVVRQVLDGVKLSFQSSGHKCGHLDELLHAKGLRRM